MTLEKCLHHKLTCCQNRSSKIEENKYAKNINKQIKPKEGISGRKIFLTSDHLFLLLYSICISFCF